MKSLIRKILFLSILSFSCLLSQNLSRGENIFSKVSGGTWQVATDLGDKFPITVEYDYPNEFGFYLGQTVHEYKSTMGFTKVEVRYDNGSWITLLDGFGYTTGEFIPPWSSQGTHTMDVRYFNMAGISRTINHTVYV